MTESQELQYLRGKCSSLEDEILNLRRKNTELGELLAEMAERVTSFSFANSISIDALREIMAQCEAENEVAGYMVINLGRAEDIMEKIKEVK